LLAISLISMDAKRRFIATLEVLFGKGVSEHLPLHDLRFVYSKRTGKVKYVMLNDTILCTFRSDGGIALSIELARLLIHNPRFMDSCIVVSNDVAEYVAEGRSVFCKHIKYVGNNIHVNSEVVVLDEDRNVIAVGKAVLPSSIIKCMKYGVAVKIRDGIGMYRVVNK